MAVRPNVNLHSTKQHKSIHLRGGGSSLAFAMHLRGGDSSLSCFAWRLKPFKGPSAVQDCRFALFTSIYQHGSRSPLGTAATAAANRGPGCKWAKRTCHLRCHRLHARHNWSPRPRALLPRGRNPWSAHLPKVWQCRRSHGVLVGSARRMCPLWLVVWSRSRWK